MAPVEWTSDLSVGVEVIDNQHKRIVLYINQLQEARKTQDRVKVGTVLSELVDYTQSHFGFEEAMLEEAGYPYLKAHKRVHELFIKRVNELVRRFETHEDVADTVTKLLITWLLNHIRSEDADYSEAVKRNLGAAHIDLSEGSNDGWLRSTLKRFFPRAA